MADADQQQQQSIDSDSKQYKINHQDWRKSKSQSPGLDGDKPPHKGRGRGWRAKARESPSAGSRQAEKETTRGHRSLDKTRQTEQDTRHYRSSDTRGEDTSHEDDRWEDADRVEEERKQEKKRQEQRRKEDERKWEEDRGWKGGDKKISRPRPIRDVKESSSTEKSRKPRRAPQEVYVPRARRQPQQLYVPRARRLQMEEEEKTKVTSAHKEDRKATVAREPPEKRRIVTSHTQRSGHQESKSEKSVSRTSQVSELKHKSDKYPDTRDERQTARGQPARTDNSGTGESRDKDLSRGRNQGSYVQRDSRIIQAKQSQDHYSDPEEQRDDVHLPHRTNQGKLVQNAQSGEQDQFHLSSMQKNTKSLSSDKIMDEDYSGGVSELSSKCLDQIDATQEKEASECPDASIDKQLPCTEDGPTSNNMPPIIISSSDESLVQSDGAIVRVDRVEGNEVDNLLTSGVDGGSTFPGDTSTVCPDAPQNESQRGNRLAEDISRGVEASVCDADSRSYVRDTTINTCVSQGSNTCQSDADNIDISSNNLQSEYSAPPSQDVEDESDKIEEENVTLDSSQCNEKEEKEEGVLVECEKDKIIENTCGEVVDEVEDNVQMETDSGDVHDLPDEITNQPSIEILHSNASGGIQTVNTSTTRVLLDNARENKSKVEEEDSQYENADTTERTAVCDSHENVEQGKPDSEEGGARGNDNVVGSTNSTSGGSEIASLEASASHSNATSDSIIDDSLSCVDREKEVAHQTETDTSGNDITEGSSEEESSGAAEADVEEEEKMSSSQEDAMETEEQGGDGEVDEDSWDALFNESGECLKPEEEQELADGIGKVKVSVKKPKRDYYNYQPKDNMDYSAFEHVIEVYDFPAEFKTPDLVMSFSDFKNKGFDIKWVDETHALAIFATPLVAQDALGLLNPMLRTRPLSLATRESKMKAKKCIEFMQPYKSRPETTAAAARRLVSGALGLRSKETKEQRAAERRKLREARDKKRADRQQTHDVWEGNV